jgi:hypothetical protein
MSAIAFLDKSGDPHLSKDSYYKNKVIVALANKVSQIIGSESNQAKL